MRSFIVFASLLLLAAPAAAQDNIQCEKFRTDQDNAFKSAILHAAGNLDKKARCVASRNALSYLDKMVEASAVCPAADASLKDMVSKRKATHIRNCGAQAALF
jgi:hypothetical protein